MRKVVALVGRKAAAEILGVWPENMGKVVDLPPPLNDRGIEGFDVTVPVWPRAEIEELASQRASRSTTNGR